jgi:hypothetical protein
MKMKTILATLCMIMGLGMAFVNQAQATELYKVIVQPINGTQGSAVSGIIGQGDYLNFRTYDKADAPQVYMELREHNHQPYLGIVPNTQKLARLEEYRSDDGLSNIQLPVVNHRYSPYEFHLDERSHSQTVKVRFPESKVDNMRVTIIRLDNEKH